MPKKSLIQVVVIVVFLSILGIRMFYLKVGSLGRPLSSPANAMAYDVTSALAKIKDAASRTGKILTGKFSTGRNPFRMPDDFITVKSPVVRNQESSSPLKLEGVIWGSNRNLAVISGSVVTEGETVNGATVSRIDEQGVTLNRNGTEIKLER